MATTLYFRYTGGATVAETWSNGAAYTTLGGSSLTYYPGYLSGSRGAGAVALTTITQDGPTAGNEIFSPVYGSNYPVLFISPPLAADVRIYQSITFNVWAMEGSMSCNAATNCRVMRIDGATGAVTQILKTARTTELGTTDPPPAASNWSGTPTDTTFNRGDRIVAVQFLDDAGTMSYQAVNNWHYVDGATGGANGDSYLTFTETLSFESAPAGTSVYLTATSAGIDPGSATELEAWTSRGGGVATAATSTVNGLTDPIQITATTGGTAVEWYTKSLTAVTLSGPVLVNVRGAVGNAVANAGYRCELAVCAANGTGATVWAVGGRANEITTTEAVHQFWVSGDDLSITEGQRVRIRIWIDDCHGSTGGAVGQMVTGYTATTYYAGAAGATGDSYLTFPITLTEYAAPSADVGMPYIGGGYYA